MISSRFITRLAFAALVLAAGSSNWLHAEAQSLAMPEGYCCALQPDYQTPVRPLAQAGETESRSARFEEELAQLRAMSERAREAAARETAAFRARNAAVQASFHGR